jgi:hypothetical protein
LKRLMRTHRYLSCFVAPAMLFFAISGAWQSFRLHEDRKDGSYTAPAALSTLSEMHKAERIGGPLGTLFRWGQALLAAGFVFTAILGLIMAFKLSRPTWTVWACLLAGIVIPILLAWVARANAPPRPTGPPGAGRDRGAIEQPAR